MSALLQLDGVTRRFGGLLAVSEIDAEVTQGEIYGVIGPNGAGKTTLFAMIAGSLRPTAGKIVLDGHDITGKRAHRVVRRGIARTYQVVRPFPNLTTVENVEVGLLFGNRRVSSRRVEALELVERCDLA